MRIPLSKVKKKNALQILNFMGWSNGPTGGRIWTKGSKEMSIDSTKQLKTFALLSSIGMKTKLISKQILKLRLP